MTSRHNHHATSACSRSLVDANIEDHGFHMNLGYGCTTHPAVCCTVGLLLRGHPELMTLDLAPESCAGLFGHLHDEIAAGRSFPLGVDFELGTHRVPHRLVPVPIESWVGEDCLLRGIDQYYANKPDRLREVSVLQVVWPDPDRRLPWDPNCEMTVWRDQPILGEGDPRERKAADRRR